MHKIIVVALTAMLLATASPRSQFLSVAIAVDAGPVAATPSVSVGPQYDTTHVYVAPAERAARTAVSISVTRYPVRSRPKG